MEYLLTVTRTKTGLPAVAETGAAGKTKGFARILCRDNGGKKTATYLPQPEEIEDIGHVVFVLQKNDYCIAVERSRTTAYKITVTQFSGTIDDQEQALFELRHSYSGKRWDVMPPEYLQPAIEAAKAKSQAELPAGAWYQTKQPSPPVSPSAPVLKPGDFVPSFLGIRELRQIADDEFSVCLTNGVQFLVYIKECLPKRNNG
ncbi:hypothetical protein [Sporomusa sp. KB1]|jgi:hypothetical protein|uniref:hypothetical protein n=1 Tax=Sporomusa sp. KB1 TaxID=943346 RepID=UPI0011A7A04C|nr:hypothetical protein [Sporomusa sp. KB1]TWH45920.1 hypothetical protein Salpa_1852 [Sporomusa sp. KB1]